VKPSDVLRQHIEAALPAARARTFEIEHDGQSVWVKRPRRGPGYVLYGLQAVTAALLRIPSLRPPRVSRRAAGLYAEARRLSRLERKGWPVPRVLDVCDRWLALRDNGRSLAPLLREMPMGHRLDLLRAALAYLQSLHAQGGWHGAGQVRNFTRLGSGFGLLDFEDDIEPSMPLATRQVRDILLFVISAARLADGDHRAVQTLLADGHSRAPPDVQAELRAVAAKLVRARRLLAPVMRWSGPDGRSLALVTHACEEFLASAARAGQSTTGPAHEQHDGRLAP
jgi:hypothetical protein